MQTKITSRLLQNVIETTVISGDDTSGGPYTIERIYTLADGTYLFSQKENKQGWKAFMPSLTGIDAEEGAL